MSGKNINLDNKAKKSDFCKRKKVFTIDDIDVDKILVSKKEPYGTNWSIKYFIGYIDDDDDNDVIRPICIKLLQMIGCVKCFDSNETTSFKVIDNKLLKKCTQIWKKVRHLLKKKFNSEPVYGVNDKYIQRKIKTYGDKININFQGKKLSKQNTPCKWWSLIVLDSVIKVNKKYFPQILLEECIYEIKKTKMENVIND